MTRRQLTVGITAGAAVLAMLGAAAPAALAGSGGGPAPLPRLGKVTPMYDVGVQTGRASSAAAVKAGGLKVWSKTVSDGGSFTYRMVGNDPTIHESLPSTTIKTALVPVIIKFSDGFSWDPTLGDTCDTTSAVARTMASPMVTSTAWSFGGTSVGTGQYSDAFQRASFYTQTNPAGINPGYHVKLAYSLRPAVTINVPAADAAIGTISCGNGKLGAVEINWLDSYIKTHLLPPLRTQGFGNKTLPIFLLGNVVEYIGTPSNCCVLGYHNATSTASSAQTYSVSMYDNTGVFKGSSDVSVLSHEVAEWLDDPFTNNPTKPWGHIGQVTGCQSNLEVGDPLSGTVTTLTVSGKLYHLQELAFVSWFYHQIPSTGVNGWYSNLGTFTSAAARRGGRGLPRCRAGPTGASRADRGDRANRDQQAGARRVVPSAGRVRRRCR